MSTKRKPPATLAKPALQQNAQTPHKSRIDDSRTTVSKTVPVESTSQSEMIEISSDSTSDYDDEDFADDEEPVDDEKDGKADEVRQQQLTPPETVQASLKSELIRPNVQVADDENGGSEDGEEDSSDEPVFSQFRGRDGVVDVPSGLADPRHQNALSIQQSLSAPGQVTTSLGTVLNQALRTDDTDLLDTCLNTSDIPTVRATISRLDSNLAGALLQKLAQRLHRRPGRAHSLMSWVQWTLVAHGGALAARPEITRQLADLSRVLDERARGLNSLLVLKGKLDLLEAQMVMRRENRSRGTGGWDDRDEELDDDREGIVYVEGESEDEDAAATKLMNGKSRTKRSIADGDEEEDGVPLINGTARDSDDDEDEEGSDDDDMDVDRNGLIDDEAEESMDEDEVDYDDEDEEEDEDDGDDSDVDVAPPPKKLKQASTSSRRR
jgi:U3 small nucleolar RNA-associated protein 5